MGLAGSSGIGFFVASQIGQLDDFFGLVTGQTGRADVNG
jgi:hypothetical protein